MGTIGKTLSLLEHFSAERPEIGLSEFQRLTGFSKATTHRHLIALTEAEFLEKVEENQAYRLGPALTRLAKRREETAPAEMLVKPLVERLSRALGELAHHSALVGDRMKVVAFADRSEHGLRISFDLDEDVPFHATSSGKAALAYMPPERRAALLDGPLPAYTDRTVTDRDRLLEALEETRRRGFAHCDETREIGVCSFAVPIFDGVERVSGALAVAYPASRDSADRRARIVAALKEAGAEATHLLGGALPDETRRLWER